MTLQVDIVVPVLNEQHSLDKFISTLRSELDFSLPVEFKILFVDDGSTDLTWKEITKLRERYNFVRAIKLTKNFGKEPALLAGITYSKADAIIPMDVDLQDPPKIINSFVNSWLNGAKMVVGKRISRDEEGFLKRFTANIFYEIYNLISDVPIPKNVGDFRIIDKEIANNLRMIKGRNLFLKGIFASIHEVDEVIEFERTNGLRSESNRPKQNYAKLVNLAEIAISSAGPRLFRKVLGLSLIIDFILLIFTIFVFCQWIFSTTPFNGFTTLAIFLSLSIMLQVTFLSALGVIVSRILQNQLNTPAFIVSDTL